MEREWLGMQSQCINGYLKKKKFSGKLGLLFLIYTKIYFGCIASQNDNRW